MAILGGGDSEILEIQFFLVSREFYSTKVWRASEVIDTEIFDG